jgi:hypothetical protein
MQKGKGHLICAKEYRVCAETFFAPMERKLTILPGLEELQENNNNKKKRCGEFVIYGGTCSQRYLATEILPREASKARGHASTTLPEFFSKAGLFRN